MNRVYNKTKYCNHKTWFWDSRVGMLREFSEIKEIYSYWVLRFAVGNVPLLSCKKWEGGRVCEGVLRFYLWRNSFVLWRVIFLTYQRDLIGLVRM